MVPAGEPGHGDHIADDGGGDDRPGAEDPGDAGAGCPGRGGQRLAGFAPLGIQAADAGQQLGGELAARLGNSARWPDLAEEPGGPACGDLRAGAAGNQPAHQRMGPAGGLVAGPGKIAVPFGPHLQHGGVVTGDHLPPGRGPQRRHRHRQGIAGVALAGVPGLQQPHPGGQLGLRIEHPLTRGGQLLREEIAEPAGALHRPGPLRPGLRPGDQLPGLGRAGPDPQPAQPLPGRADRHRGARALTRGRSRSSLPSAHSTSSPGDWTDRGGHALYRTCAARSPLFRDHATARSGGAGTST